MNRTSRVVALTVLIAVGASACVPGVRAGARCRTTDFGDDGTYVLRCQNGRWVRAATKEQVAQLIVSILRARTTTSTTPPTTTTAVPYGRDGTVRPVSVTDSGIAGDGRSDVGDISDDGRYVVFMTRSTNLPAGSDTYGHIVLKDMVTGTITRVSHVAGDTTIESNGFSTSPQMTPDGRYVVYGSSSSDIVTPDLNGFDDIFRWDRLTGLNELISKTNGGLKADDHSQRPSISDDGSKVVFGSAASNLVVGDTNGAQDVFLREGMSTTLVSSDSVGVLGNDSSSKAMIAGDGTVVVFESNATNLVADDTNASGDVFVKRLSDGTVQRISVRANGSQVEASSYDSSISADGSKVAFVSQDNFIVAGDSGDTSDVFVRNVAAGTNTLAGVTSSGGRLSARGGQGLISASGRFVTFLSGSPEISTGVVSQAFVRDLTGGTTFRASRTSTGGETPEVGAAAISANGRYVTFTVMAASLISSVDPTNQMYVFDRGPIS